MRVVIADDTSTQRDKLKRIVEQAGHEVVEACKNGLQAVKACESHLPDVVMLDMSMPEMDGEIAAGLIQDAGTAKKIIIVSSMMQDVTRHRLMARGYRIFGKPYDPGKLGAALSEE